MICTRGASLARCSIWERWFSTSPSTLKEFKEMVRQDFAGPGPYPMYVHTDFDLEFGQSGNERDHRTYEPSTVVRASLVRPPDPLLSLIHSSKPCITLPTTPDTSPWQSSSTSPRLTAHPHIALHQSIATIFAFTVTSSADPRHPPPVLYHRCSLVQS
jgi:hypothetical protein